ncbi:MAG: type II toxin-antitoxin system RelE/ParE family toxin [Gemmataceae bacterium]
MSLPLSIRPEAEQDLADARDWYEQQREGLGIEFATAVEETFARIGDFPETYAAGYGGVRPVGLRRFPYVVYYRIIRDGVEVLAVLHGSRHVRQWRSRL